MATPLARGWEIKFDFAIVMFPGERFQDLFAAIMERGHPGFQRIRPWGAHGDQKNDGWLPETETLFQCYAPSTFAAGKLETKLTEDYDGAVEHWEGRFTRWVFVHNDRGGLGPVAAKHVQDLDGRSDLIACTTWGPFQLREEFAKLSDADRVAILGPPLTSADFVNISAQALNPMIDALGKQKPDPNAEVGPVPIEKVEANDLSEAQVTFLRMGAGRAPLVDRYLNNAYNLPAEVDEIAAAVADRYQDLRDAGQAPAQTLEDLIAWISGGDIDSGVQANAWAIVAYFFDRCHIFEVPGP